MTEKTAMPQYTVTTGELARQAGIGQPTVRTYADAGLLDCVVISNGTRLFREGQASEVRAIYTRRMANRGNRKARPAAPDRLS